VGRGFKVGKEEICGLVAALMAYGSRDFNLERARCTRIADTLASGLNGLPGVRSTKVDATAMGRPGPHVELVLDGTARMTASYLVNLLQANDPIICTWEGRAFQGLIGLYPDALVDCEAEQIVATIHGILSR